MKRKASATLIGTFVVAGIALIATAIIALAGNNLFTPKERTVMYFSGSVYGLQVGAPVVFRGVRVGSVESIQVSYDRNTDAFSIPVVAVLDSDAVRGLDGKQADAGSDPELALPALVKRGLNAQLSMQSLLTGQLYVDLDLRPRRFGDTHGDDVLEGVVDAHVELDRLGARHDQEKSRGDVGRGRNEDRDLFAAEDRGELVFGIAGDQGHGPCALVGITHQHRAPERLALG